MQSNLLKLRLLCFLTENITKLRKNIYLLSTFVHNISTILQNHGWLKTFLLFPTNLSHQVINTCVFVARNSLKKQYNL